jgi:hypothetical protein
VVSRESEITAQIGEAPWSALEPHAARQALFYVAPELTLTEVGVALAEDQKELVARWLASGLLKRPAAEAIATYRASGGVFRFVIIQPFVLFQERQDA